MLYVCGCLFKQKTAYEMRISDWSSDVCSSDLQRLQVGACDSRMADVADDQDLERGEIRALRLAQGQHVEQALGGMRVAAVTGVEQRGVLPGRSRRLSVPGAAQGERHPESYPRLHAGSAPERPADPRRSEEHTSELQSL